MHVERPLILCFYLFLNFTLFTTTLHAQIESDSRLYNGREYIRNGTPAKGFPYFEWDSLTVGLLNYDGISYNIPLEYDLAQDQLVIRNSTGDILISLVPEKISRFSIGPYAFRHVGPGIAHLPESGFYQELFVGGTVTLLARKHKTLVIPTSMDQLAHYVQFDAYFLLLNGSAYKVAGERELLDVLNDRKAELKKYIRENRLSFKRNTERSLIQTIAYYQQLKS